jgi:hypothetical protein
MLRAVAVEDQPSPRYRQGTMHGWPDYGTSSLSYVLHALWAASAKDFGTFRAHGETLASIMEEETPMSATMGNRTGPLGKPVIGISITNDGAYQDAELVGLCCRRRIVYMMSSAGNMWQVPHAWKIKARQRAIPQLQHFGPADCAEKVSAWHTPGMMWISDDISGFDQSVSDAHQREMIAEVYSPIIGQDASAFMLDWKDVPLLGPGLDTSHEGFLYRKLGMTASGDLKTALDGTVINFARLLRCVAVATGHTLAATVAGLGRWWHCLVQGDDTVLGCSVPFDRAKYVATSEALGYATKLQDGVVFLMHAFLPATGAWAPLASRVFQQSVFNEYGGESPAVELFSFIARTPDHFWNRNPWADRVTGLFADGSAFVRYGVTPRTAHSAMTNPTFMADLAKDLGLIKGRAERFKSVEDSMFNKTYLSDAVARLLDDRSEIELPRLTPAEAWDAAQRLAQYMAIPGDDRPRQLPTLGGPADDYLTYVQTGEHHDIENEAE